MKIKKIILILIILLTTIFTTNIIYANTKYENITKTFDAFGTGGETIRFSVSKANNKSESEIKKILEEAKELTLKLSDLSDNFTLIDNLNNIIYINNNPETKIEIEKDLYEMLELSLLYEKKTNGYFNVSIGKIIDEWKELIDTREKYITKEEYEKRVKKIKEIPVIENGIKLSIDSNKYYVKIKEGVKIDLGAIAKGYAIERVDKYFKSKGLKYYQIDGSSSSMNFGENPNRDKNVFHIELTNPYISKYAYIKVKNTNVTTSGDTAQHNQLHGKFLHHIISPFEKEPLNNYRAITLISDDGGYGDALSTAMFNMDEKTLLKFASDNNIEFIAFKYDESVINKFEQTEIVYFDNNFEQKPKDPVKQTFTDWLIISGVIISLGVIFYFVGNKFDQNNKKEN